MNTFILSGKGFLKEFHRNLDYSLTPIWTPLLREAKRYSSKQAKNVICSNGLDAFIWNPYVEEPIRDKWKVVRRRDYHNFNTGVTHEVLEWYVEKVIMESKTDVKFLNQKDKQPEDYYSHEEAVELARHRNLNAMDELILKNKLLGKS